MADPARTADIPVRLPAPGRVERRRARVREAILDAAEQLFARHGADALSMRRLAGDLELSPAAIYKYFGSKEELLGALREQFFQRLLERVEHTAITPAPTPQVRLRDMVRVYVETALERPHHYAAAFAPAAAGPPPRTDGSAEAAADRAHAILMTAIAEDLEAGRLRPADPELVAMQVWVVMHGLSMVLIHKVNRPADAPCPSGVQGVLPDLDPGALCDAMADLVWRGLGA
jgi:AcrR family transcriptional regulator